MSPGKPGAADLSEACNDKIKNNKKTTKRRGLDKDPAFTTAVRSLCQDVTHFLLQNRTIDMFEDYFAGQNPTHQQTTMSTSTVAVTLFLFFSFLLRLVPLLSVTCMRREISDSGKPRKKKTIRKEEV